jgi:hypothetical protein
LSIHARDLIVHCSESTVHRSEHQCMLSTIPAVVLRFLFPRLRGIVRLRLGFCSALSCDPRPRQFVTCMSSVISGYVAVIYPTSSLVVFPSLQAKRLEGEYKRKVDAAQTLARSTLTSELHRLSMEKERAVAEVRDELLRQQREREERCVGVWWAPPHPCRQRCAQCESSFQEGCDLTHSICDFRIPGCRCEACSPDLCSTCGVCERFPLCFVVVHATWHPPYVISARPCPFCC